MRILLDTEFILYFTLLSSCLHGFSEFPGSVILSATNLISQYLQLIITSNICFVPFSLLFLIFLLCSYTFCGCLAVLGYSASFFTILLCVFSLGQFYLCIFTSVILSLAIHEYIHDLLKSILHFLKKFLISRIPFEFFLRVSLSLFTSFICSCMLFISLLESLTCQSNLF